MSELDPRKIAIAQAAVEEWQALAAEVAHLETLITMSPEEEGLADLFKGVLSALKLHRDHSLTDCLTCGNKVTAADLIERIELAEQYSEAGKVSKNARLQAQSTRDKAALAEARAMRLLEEAALPMPPQPQIPTKEELLSWRWTPEQVAKLTDNAKRYILRHTCRPEYFSVLTDGSLYELREGRGKAIFQSLEGVRWS
jgi:hypothetical protein